MKLLYLQLQILVYLIINILVLIIETLAFTGLITIGVIVLGVLIINIKNKLTKNKGRRLDMNTIQKLLSVDLGKVKTPTKDVTLRLQRIGGEEFVFPCQAVDAEYVAELQENAIEFKKSELNKIKVYDTKVMTIVEGCPSIFKSDEVLKHFKAPTPKDLVNTLLLSGEMDELKSEIDKLGGYNKDDKVEDIKKK